VLLDQLRAVATAGDVVVGISASGYTPSLMRAFEFATETGCRTICICGPVGGILETMSDVAVLVPASKIGSVEDAQMIVCRLIGHLFSDSQARS
jgi:D-sedoheptulose 7-phosphate isomerase